jgi:hypothetical protein
VPAEKDEELKVHWARRMVEGTKMMIKRVK